MDIIQQYKMTGFMRGLTKVAANAVYRFRQDIPTPTTFRVQNNPFSGGLHPKEKVNTRAQNLSTEVSQGIARLRKKTDEPGTGAKPKANASKKPAAQKKTTKKAPTAEAQTSKRPAEDSGTDRFAGSGANPHSQSSLKVNPDTAVVNSTTLTVNSNQARTRRRFRQWLSDTYHRHPKMTIATGAGAVTAAGAGLTSLIAALSGDSAPSVAAGVGPAADREQPKRRYTQFGKGDVDRNHSNWDWYKQQFDDSAKGRAGALAEAARQQAAAGIPEHLRYRAALQQSFADPNALDGKQQAITKARLEHAARQQAIQWLKHLGIPASQYNVSQMSKYFSDYSRYAQFGGIAPDIQQYFRHLNTTNYKQALKTLGKWRKAVSHGF